MSRIEPMVNDRSPSCIRLTPTSIGKREPSLRHATVSASRLGTMTRSSGSPISSASR
jgi:hypothetical protein